MAESPMAFGDILEVFFTYAALGLIVGFGYYASSYSHAGFLSKDAPEWVHKLLMVFRVGAAVIFFAWLAGIGALQILSAFVGFLVGREIALKGIGERT